MRPENHHVSGRTGANYLLPPMNLISNFLKSLDWRVLFAVPVLSVLLGVANNMRVSEDRRVIWSGDFPTMEEMAETDVECGTWTTDFAAATNAAEVTHLPVVVVALFSRCPSCRRFHQEIQNEEITAWQKKLGWYFVMLSYDEDPEAFNFVKNTPVSNEMPPCVWVYWSRADGKRVIRNFSAVSKHMGIPAEPSLRQEWMHAVEATFPGAPGVSFVPPHGVGVQIAVKAESRKRGRGQVEMSPQVDVVLPGQKVVLTAKPKTGSVFAGWQYPDGRIVDGEPQLTLDDQCQAGEYRAIFHRRKDDVEGGVLKTDGKDK